MLNPLNTQGYLDYKQVPRDRYIYIAKYHIIQVYSGITSGRVLDGELLYTKIQEVTSTYDKLVSQKVLPLKAEEKWLQENIEINWNSVTENKILNQLEPKIREFNYKFLNKISAKVI